MESQQTVRVVTSGRVKELAAKLCRDEIDDDASEVLAAMADDVLLSIVSWAAALAKKRGSPEVEESDVRKACEIEWGLTLEDLEDASRL